MSDGKRIVIVDIIPFHECICTPGVRHPRCWATEHKS